MKSQKTVVLYLFNIPVQIMFKMNFFDLPKLGYLNVESSKPFHFNVSKAVFIQLVQFKKCNIHCAKR